MRFRRTPKHLAHSIGAFALLLVTFGIAGAQEADSSRSDGMPLGAFRFRSIGPAFTSGRIADIAVHPDKTTWYVGIASGGVWKTENANTALPKSAAHSDTPSSRRKSQPKTSARKIFNPAMATS